MDSIDSTGHEPRPVSDAAMTDLVTKHLPLVRVLAAKLYRMRWDNSVEFDEYCQLGSVGLIEAAQRYDPSKGAQFGTFASWRITGAILNGLERCTERHQQIAARKHLVRDRLGSLAGTESAPVERDTGSVEAALSRLSAAAVGLAVGFMLEGSGMYSDGSEHTAQDGYTSLAMAELRRRLHAAVEALSPQEQVVVKGHYLQQRQFAELAEQLNLTKGRISQIHRQAVERLRSALREDLIGFQG